MMQARIFVRTFGTLKSAAPALQSIEAPIGIFTLRQECHPNRPIVCKNNSPIGHLVSYSS